ncbi:MAG: phosphodiesterase, partial [Sphaerochaetaceae bacterium]|nr:phosphodiesterase [Sphaerochaetaceae bacterium]
MNKLLIASDLHGDAYYISKLVEAFTKEEASRLILLGDILYHGPRNAIPVNYNPSLAIPMLNSIKDKISCI